MKSLNQNLNSPRTEIRSQHKKSEEQPIKLVLWQPCV